ncbi:dihydroorotase [Luteibaculum oceani]|uniref:Amidohydrolase family protein n=1 Tax=Luteibaculum oceani TaxID=1294296 RepID=A0A5C6V1D4_9FLAO|nr:dihydroorotase [Luteibaculum oceani]TXC78660.1 amidohydrolase family protein [Luteibaculum oceani]
MAEQTTFEIVGATLVATKHPLNGKKIVLAVESGRIKEISEYPKATKNSKSINGEGLSITPGFVDLLGSFCDPGMEHREDFLSGAEAALYGGYTHVGVNPFNEPVADSKSGISYVKAANQSSKINLLPLGTLSVGGANTDIPELHDMAHTGAYAFFSGKKQLSEKLLLTALEYCQGIDALPMVFPIVDSLAEEGQINESIVSSQTGLKAIPNIAESMALANILKLAKYSGGSVHISHISCEESVALIKKAKEEGVRVTCAVASHQLIHTDKDCLDFDTRHKVLPPYRKEQDRQALISACKEGIVDAIISDHSPVDIEAKKTEFDHAEFGIINFQTAFSSLWAADVLPIDKLVELMAENPAKILKLKTVGFEIGTEANFNLIATDKKYNFPVAEVKSKSLNSPFLNKELKGEILYTAAKGKLYSKIG